MKNLPSATPLMKIRSYTQEEKQKYYRTWKQSGQARKAFCRDHGLPASTLRNWIKKIEGPAAQEPMKLLRLASPQARQAASPTTPAMLLELAEGVTLKLPLTVTPDWLLKLLRGLSQ